LSERITTVSWHRNKNVLGASDTKYSETKDYAEALKIMSNKLLRGLGNVFALCDYEPFGNKWKHTYYVGNKFT
jgi:hypothetical protein